MVSKEGGFLGKTVLGLPANAFIKVLQDEKGYLNFDFKVTGNLNNLKVNAKEAIGKAIAKSIKDKIGGRIIELGTTAVKEMGGKIIEKGKEAITTKTEESIKGIFDKFGK